MFYVDFLDNFGQRQGIYEKMATKLEENREEDLYGGVSFINDPFPRILHQQLGAQRPTLMIPRSSREGQVGLLFIFSYKKTISLILRGLLEVPIFINKKAYSLSSLASY